MLIIIISFIIFFIRCKVTLRKRGSVGVLWADSGGGETNRGRGLSYSWAQGRGLGREQSQYDDSIQQRANPPSHTTSPPSSGPGGRRGYFWVRNLPFPSKSSASLIVFRGTALLDSRSVCLLLRPRGEFSRYFPMLLSDDEGAPRLWMEAPAPYIHCAIWVDIYQVEMNNWTDGGFQNACRLHPCPCLREAMGRFKSD